MTTTKTRTRELLHPLLKVPAVVVVTGYYQRNGRNIGEVLQFVDGHRASLTYAEISNLEAELRGAAVSAA